MRANNYIKRACNFKKENYYNLSDDAKKVLFLMLSKSKKWHFSINGLMYELNMTQYKIKKALKELQEKHYLIIKKVRDLLGCFCGYNYYIFESKKDYSKDIINKLQTNKIKWLDIPKVEIIENKKNFNLNIFKYKRINILKYKNHLKKILKTEYNKELKKVINTFILNGSNFNKWNYKNNYFNYDKPITIYKDFKLKNHFESIAFKNTRKNNYFNLISDILMNKEIKNFDYLTFKEKQDYFKHLENKKLTNEIIESLKKEWHKEPNKENSKYINLKDLFNNFMNEITTDKQEQKKEIKKDIIYQSKNCYAKNIDYDLEHLTEQEFNKKYAL